MENNLKTTKCSAKHDNKYYLCKKQDKSCVKLVTFVRIKQILMGIILPILHYHRHLELITDIAVY